MQDFALWLCAITVLAALAPQPVNAQSKGTLLFEGQGSSTIEKNAWSGWYSKGQLGAKKSAYDTLPLARVRFEDDSGRYVDYTLDKAFSGRTLLSVVQGCAPTRTTGWQDKWTSGICQVATVASSSHTQAALRIAVGDGQSSGSSDWALFMPLSGNGQGDYNGNNIWAFGGEATANDGYAGAVRIWGTPAGLLMYGICHSLRVYPPVTCLTMSLALLSYPTGPPRSRLYALARTTASQHPDLHQCTCASCLGPGGVCAITHMPYPDPHM